MFETLQASGFTHFQQSGTGAIRTYDNYVRVTPVVAPLDDLGEAWPLHDETAAERRDREHRGREHALAFDRVRVFDDLFRVGTTVIPQPRPEGRAAETV